MILTKLIKFIVSATPETFETIFGSLICDHLWVKWTHKYQHNFTLFVTSLDGDNLKKLNDYLTTNYLTTD